jgi:hypothetical protein
MNARTAAQAIAKAIAGEASVTGFYLDAYAACQKASTGGDSLRAIADECKALGIKANKDTVGDYVFAATLTAHADGFHAAITQVYGEGAIVRAHSLVGAARSCKGQGVPVIRTILGPVSEALAATERDDAAICAAILKAVKALKGVKPAKPLSGEVLAEPAEAADVEQEEAVDAPEADPADRGHALALALVGPANALAKALQDGDAILTEQDRVALMGALAALVKVVKAA